MGTILKKDVRRDKMKSLQGTETADNLARAFAGESQARNRYTFYSKTAQKEGHVRIANIFWETAENERAHAKVFFDLLVKGLGKAQIHVDTDYPIGFDDTVKNLQYAAEGEKEEWGTAYPSFEKKAAEEGFPEVATAFRTILSVEKHHEQRFLDLMHSLQAGTLYRSDTEQEWKCSNCGYVHKGTNAPEVCPACMHPQGYFEIMYDTAKL